MKSSHKLILILSIVIVIGYTWSLDMPLALEVPLRQEPYNFSNFEYNFLYFATYIAIFFSDMPVGMVLDKLPIKKTIIFLAVLSLLSVVGTLFMFHFQMTGYKIIVYILRGIFGVTGEALYTIQALLISLYGGKYYDLIIGAAFCIPLAFNSVNNILTPLMFDSTKSMELVWGIGSLFCGIALVSSLIIARVVLKQEKLSEQQNKAKSIKNQSEQQEEQLNFNGLKSMPKDFWVIVGAVFFTEIVLGSYIDNLNDSIVKRFSISYVNAGYLMFIPYGAAAIICFLLGLLLDKRPKMRRPLMTLSNVAYSIGLLLVYFLPNVTDDQETTSLHYVVIAFQFLTVSSLVAILYGVLSSAIVYVVSPKHLGIAWGVIGSTIGFSQATSPLLIASILQSQDTLPDGYKKLTLYIFFASLFALAFSFWILLGSFESIDVNSSENISVGSLKQSLIEQDQITHNSFEQKFLEQSYQRV